MELGLLPVPRRMLVPIILLVACAPATESAPTASALPSVGGSERSELSQRIASTPDGGIVQLGRGEYRLDKGILLRRPVHIRGAGRDETSITGSIGIVFEGPGTLVLEGITFRHQGPEMGTMVLIAGGEVQVRNSRFTGGVLPRDPALGYAQGYGLFFTINAQGGEVLDSDFVDNAAYGLGAAVRAQVTLEGNTFRGNGQGGIAFFDDAGGIVRNNAITDNFRGIDVFDRAAPRITDNTLTANTRNGIRYADQAAGKADGNVVDGNQQNGIALWGEAAPIITGNTITGSFLNGIAVAGEARPVIEHNTVSGNREHGIVIVESGRPTLRENVVEANGMAGVMVAGESSPTLERNTIIENAGPGIRFVEQATGTARGNISAGNAGGGIALHDYASPTLEQNVMRGNSGDAIGYFQFAAGAASDNTCEGERTAIRLSGNARPTLAVNDCDLLDTRARG
jgi:parallel beta-helix repeat protein